MGSTDDAAPRFRMLEVIRAFAAERLRARPEAAAVARRHAQAYLDLARTAEPWLLTKDRGEWLDRLTREHANLHAALRFAIETGDATTAQCLVGSLWRYWQVKGLLVEAGDHIGQALALGEDDPNARLAALAAAGGVAYWRGEFKSMQALYEEALVLAERQCRVATHTSVR